MVICRIPFVSRRHENSLPMDPDRVDRVRLTMFTGLFYYIPSQPHAMTSDEAMINFDEERRSLMTRLSWVNLLVALWPNRVYY